MVTSASNNVQLGLVYDDGNARVLVYFNTQQKFTLNATGLKPSTRHYFYFDGKDNSSICVPVGGNMGDNLISDSSGKIQFDFYYNYQLPSSGTNLVQLQNQINSLSGVKVCTMQNSDNTSFSTCKINFLPKQVNVIPQLTTTSTASIPTLSGIGGGAWKYNSLINLK